MSLAVECSFLEVVEEITALVDHGHTANTDRILTLMSALSADGLALRYFLYKGCLDARFRKLTSAQSFFVYGCESFYLRLNAWYAKSTLVDSQSVGRLERYFSIDNCHNHSFDFFTVGLLGSGYTTDFGSTSENLSNLQVGDRIRFDRVWSDQLTRGRAFFVEKGVMFHTQYAPADYSVSLNLMIRKDQLCRQFSLGADKETVSEIYDLSDTSASGEDRDRI